MTPRRVKEAEEITKNLPCRSISEQQECQVRIAGITHGTSISYGIGAPAAACPVSCVGTSAARPRLLTRRRRRASCRGGGRGCRTHGSRWRRGTRRGWTRWRRGGRPVARRGGIWFHVVAVALRHGGITLRIDARIVDALVLLIAARHRRVALRVPGWVLLRSRRRHIGGVQRRLLWLEALLRSSAGNGHPDTVHGTAQ